MSSCAAFRSHDPRSFDSSDEVQQHAFPNEGFEGSAEDDHSSAGCDPNADHLK
jgi:hypothetical protein